jgi:hypothetical protein
MTKTNQPEIKKRISKVHYVKDHLPLIQIYEFDDNSVCTVTDNRTNYRAPESFKTLDICIKELSKRLNKDIKLISAVYELHHNQLCEDIKQGDTVRTVPSEDLDTNFFNQLGTVTKTGTSNQLFYTCKRTGENIKISETMAKYKYGSQWKKKTFKQAIPSYIVTFTDKELPTKFLCLNRHNLELVKGL